MCKIKVWYELEGPKTGQIQKTVNIKEFKVFRMLKMHIKKRKTGMYSIMFHSELRADMHLLNVEQSIEISGIPDGITDHSV